MAHCRDVEDDKKICLRLSRIEGQIRGIKNMIENKRDCMAIINQVSSVSTALQGVWEILAANHLENCLQNLSVKEKNKTIEDIICTLKKLR